MAEPAGDLRERLAEALRESATPDGKTRIFHGISWTGLADAVLPVVEAETAEQRARAKQAKADRAELLEKWAILAERTLVASVVLDEAEDPEIEAHLAPVRTDLLRKILAGEAGRADLPGALVPKLAEAERQYTETTEARLAKAERQRDEALAALTTHAAEAHRRKWAHSEDNQAAFDALHRLGNEIIASRDRLIAALNPKETPRRLTEQEGGIPNDAYTSRDYPKGM